MKRKFYETTVTIKILSEDHPIDEDMSLVDIDHAISEGDCVGVTKAKAKELTAKQVAKRLREMGSAPGFFMLEEKE
jgi:hypothetical protein